MPSGEALGTSRGLLLDCWGGSGLGMEYTAVLTPHGFGTQKWGLQTPQLGAANSHHRGTMYNFLSCPVCVTGREGCGVTER